MPFPIWRNSLLWDVSSHRKSTPPWEDAVLRRTVTNPGLRENKCRIYKVETHRSCIVPYTVQTPGSLAVSIPDVFHNLHLSNMLKKSDV